MEDKYSFQEMEPEQQNILRQNYKKETQPKPHPSTKMDSKWIRNLNINVKL